MGRYELSTEHSASSYGIPVLVDKETKKTYGRGDLLPDGRPAIAVIEELEAEDCRLKQARDLLIKEGYEEQPDGTFTKPEDGK